MGRCPECKKNFCQPHLFHYSHANAQLRNERAHKLSTTSVVAEVVAMHTSRHGIPGSTAGQLPAHQIHSSATSPTTPSPRPHSTFVPPDSNGGARDTNWKLFGLSIGTLIMAIGGITQYVYENHLPDALRLWNGLFSVTYLPAATERARLLHDKAVSSQGSSFAIGLVVGVAAWLLWGMATGFWDRRVLHRLGALGTSVNYLLLVPGVIFVICLAVVLIEVIVVVFLIKAATRVRTVDLHPGDKVKLNLHLN